MQVRDSRARCSRPRPAPGAVAISLATVLVFMLYGCSSQSRYRVMSFFLDGVPDPNATTQTAFGSLIRRGNQGQIIYIHKPLMDGECNQCHKRETSALVTKATVPAEICRECHAAVDKAYAVVHGPVAVNECTQCHSPHRSTVPHLLRIGGRDLCLQCHVPFDLSTRVPQHQDATINCMDCHDAHGGATHALLKPVADTAVETLPSATQPVPEREAVP